ncbi:hypothetical protein CRUP_004773 [Coryphaenoides rupestris]|nr:hypothetical protein CRUP_004773 [Coryphaenoides rupestris]
MPTATCWESTAHGAREHALAEHAGPQRHVEAARDDGGQARRDTSLEPSNGDWRRGGRFMWKMNRWKQYSRKDQRNQPRAKSRGNTYWWTGTENPVSGVKLNHCPIECDIIGFGFVTDTLLTLSFQQQEVQYDGVKPSALPP